MMPSGASSCTIDPKTQYGPIQNRMQYERVLGILEDAKRSGARIIAGGELPSRPGYFIPPTIVADIDEHSRLVREEQFGPIVPVLKFRDIDDAVRRANDTRYGLAGSVWSHDPERAAAIAARLEVGTAWVNQHRATSATVPFGGGDGAAVFDTRVEGESGTAAAVRVSGLPRCNRNPAEHPVQPGMCGY